MVPVAWGWATVDRERAAAGFRGLDFGPAPDDEALGAFALPASLWHYRRRRIGTGTFAVRTAVVRTAVTR